MRSLLVWSFIGLLLAPIAASLPDTGPAGVIVEGLPDQRPSMYEGAPSDGPFFMENKGQKGEGAGQFYVQGAPLSAAFGTDWVAWALEREVSGDLVQGLIYRTCFNGANGVGPVGSFPVPGSFNFFIGNDPARWRTGVRGFKEVSYPDLWDGIDVRYYFHDGLLKYDLMVSPGADIGPISIEYQGVDGIRMDPGSGDMVISTACGDVVERAPSTYQLIDGRVVPVRSAYRMINDRTVGFELGDYDREHELVIDPEVAFCTYLGGSSSETMSAFDVDAEGNVYITGHTSSRDFPVSKGAYSTTIKGMIDLFVTKMDPTGSKLIYSTYIGGSSSMIIDREMSCDIKVDNIGRAVVVGISASSDFPTTNSAFQPTSGGGLDLVLFKLNETGGSLVFSTFIGGSGLDGFGSDEVNMVLNDKGNITITGPTNSKDFPLTSGTFKTTHGGGDELFLIEIGKAGQKMHYGTFLGDGRRPNLFLDPTGRVYVCGSSDNITTTASAYSTSPAGDVDGFVMKVNPTYTKVLLGTYIGGKDSDFYLGDTSKVWVDDSGLVYLIGNTDSSDFPVTRNAYDTTKSGDGESDDCVFCILTKDLDRLVYSTFFGGSGLETDMDFSVDASGKAYIAVTTDSKDMPTTPDAMNSSFMGLKDIYLGVLDYSNSIIDFGTYLGSNGTDTIIALAKGEEHLLVLGETDSRYYPVTQGAYDTTHNGAIDGTLTGISIQLGDPKVVYSVKAYSDPGCLDEIDAAEIGQTVYVELTGLDSNNSRQGSAFVKVVSAKAPGIGLTLRLVETGLDTGIYRSDLTLWSATEPLSNRFGTFLGDSIRLIALKDSTKNASLRVWGPVAIEPRGAVVEVMEDTVFELVFTEFGYNPVTAWTMTSDSDWLWFGEANRTLYGAPDNSDVGNWTVVINVTDGFGHYDSVTVRVGVKNAAPRILTQNQLSTIQNDHYLVDYDSDDEGSGATVWGLTRPLPNWLSFDPMLGIINGTPGQTDIGGYIIGIFVDDGNEGWNETSFPLEVLNLEEPPQILTDPPTEVNQSEAYQVFFSAWDIDGEHQFVWRLDTNASFLTMNNGTGELVGIPENDDVGIWYINVSASDSTSLYDFVNYTIEVFDINDPPVWVDVPFNTRIDQGHIFIFDVKAVDVDRGDSITYMVQSQPPSDISVDTATGHIVWNATLEGLRPDPLYVLQATVSATDGEEVISSSFSIEVIPNPSPVVTLLSPEAGEIVPSYGTTLEWDWVDDFTGVLCDLYIGLTYDELKAPGELEPFAGDLSEERFSVQGLEKGTRYYWTVVPRDQFSTGRCYSGIWDLTINSLPRFESIEDETIHPGEEFRLELKGSDRETLGIELEFSLVAYPEGMELSGTTHFIVWTPTTAQIGEHRVEASLFDGLEYSNTSFNITVKVKESPPIEPEDGSGLPLVLGIIAGVVVLLVVAVIVGFFVIKGIKGKKDEKEGSLPIGPAGAVVPGGNILANAISEAPPSPPSEEAPPTQEDISDLFAPPSEQVVEEPLAVEDVKEAPPEEPLAAPSTERQEAPIS